jgi:hypothetical protein
MGNAKSRASIPRMTPGSLRHYRPWGRGGAPPGARASRATPHGLDINMVSRKKHTPEQVPRKLATADQMLNEGKNVADILP